MYVDSTFIWLSRACQMNVSLSWILLEGYCKTLLCYNYFRSHSPTVVVSVRINPFTVSHEYPVCTASCSAETWQPSNHASRPSGLQCIIYLFISVNSMSAKWNAGGFTCIVIYYSMFLIISTQVHSHICSIFCGNCSIQYSACKFYYRSHTQIW